MGNKSNKSKKAEDSELSGGDGDMEVVNQEEFNAAFQHRTGGAREARPVVDAQKLEDIKYKMFSDAPIRKLFEEHRVKIVDSIHHTTRVDVFKALASNDQTIVIKAIDTGGMESAMVRKHRNDFDMRPKLKNHRIISTYMQVFHNDRYFLVVEYGKCTK